MKMHHRVDQPLIGRIVYVSSSLHCFPLYLLLRMVIHRVDQSLIRRRVNFSSSLRWCQLSSCAC